MKIDVYNQSGEIAGTAELPERIFGVSVKPNIIHEAIIALNANSRQVLAHTKGRGEVRGGGKKPWRQKGTGRARHASIRSPIWKGGGVTFGPTKERVFSKKINRKVQRAALFMALSSKVKDKELMILDSFTPSELKTKQAVKIIDSVQKVMQNFKRTKKIKDSLSFIVPPADMTFRRMLKNVPKVAIIPADSLNARDVLKNKCLVIMKNAIKVISATYK
ncbi:MAG: large subunit ribosomal protein L4 [Parcubacteria group bacterium Licking1014_17]|nr:MAG: large subunit ribosomal protein L4 [Parcubacteria group bacterium Licking1014_17]